MWINNIFNFLSEWIFLRMVRGFFSLESGSFSGSLFPGFVHSEYNVSYLTTLILSTFVSRHLKVLVFLESRDD